MVGDRNPSDYEKFQRKVFAEFDEKAQLEREKSVATFIEAGRRAQIDVISEILDKGKTFREVMDTVWKKLP